MWLKAEIPAIIPHLRLIFGKTEETAIKMRLKYLRPPEETPIATFHKTGGL